MNVLQFLAALVWPAVVVTVVLLFKTPLTERIAHLREVTAPGGSGAKFDASGPESALASVDPVGTDTSEAPGPPTGSTTNEGEKNTGAQHRRRQPGGDGVTMSRIDLQNLVREFAEAGWELRSSGAFSKMPTPVLDWSESGRPSIAHWRGEAAVDSEAAASLNATQHLARAEEDLRVATALVDLAESKLDHLLADPATSKHARNLAEDDLATARRKREEARRRRNELIHGRL